MQPYRMQQWSSDEKGDCLMVRFALLLCLGSILMTAPASARIWHVKPDSTGDAPTIQAAIDSCIPGDQVHVAEGLYEGSITLQPVISLYGGWDSEFAERDPSVYVSHLEHYAGGTSGNAVYLRRDCVIDGFRITCGEICIYLDGAYAIIINNVLTGDDAGIWCSGCSPVIEHNVFIDCGMNPGMHGAALYCDYATPLLCFNLFTGNHGFGVKAVGRHDTIVIRNNTIVNTRSTLEPLSGAGLYCWDTYGVVERNIVSGNVHGIIAEVYPPILRCNDFWDNEVSDYQGIPYPSTDISLCPSFCHAETGDFSLCDDSPCLPENNPCGQLMGSFEAGCSCGPSQTEGSTWGAIKAMYR